MNIAFLVFDKFTALDAIGPYEVLSRLPGAELSFVAKEAGPKRSDTGFLGVTADKTLDEVASPDLVLVGGGEGNRPLLRDEEVLDWLRTAHETSQWTTSVCTGSLVLGAAGILEGKRATSHWAYLDHLSGYGAEPVSERWVIDGKVVTAAGVAAGIDMALALVAEAVGEDVAKAIQLGIEYDPEPPFDSGSPAKAAPEMVEFVRQLEGGGAAQPATQPS
ncbi:MAG TPA: DJ-1/PfpI family protein [Solirubrobacterales bacterium]|nr:DJ-1/PfpI family protein [Solirubrobacterales bacterium]